MNSNEAESDAHVAFSFPRVRSVKLSVRTNTDGRTKSIVSRLLKVIRIGFVILTNNACQSLRLSKLVREASFEAKKIGFYSPSLHQVVDM